MMTRSFTPGVMKPRQSKLMPPTPRLGRLGKRVPIREVYGGRIVGVKARGVQVCGVGTGGIWNKIEIGNDGCDCDAFAPEILRFAQDDNRMFRADYILRTSSAAYCAPPTSRGKICPSAIKVRARELELVGARI